MGAVANFYAIFVQDGSRSDLDDCWAVVRYALGKGGERFDIRFKGTDWDPKDLKHDGQVLYEDDGIWPDGGEFPDALQAVLSGEKKAASDQLSSARLPLRLALEQLEHDRRSQDVFWLATGNVVYGWAGAAKVAEVKMLPRKVFAAARCAMLQDEPRVRLLVPRKGSDRLVEELRTLLGGTEGAWELKSHRQLDTSDGAVEVKIANDKGRDAFVDVIPVGTVDAAADVVLGSPALPKPAQVPVARQLGGGTLVGIALGLFVLGFVAIAWMTADDLPESHSDVAVPTAPAEASAALPPAGTGLPVGEGGDAAEAEPTATEGAPPSTAGAEPVGSTRSGDGAGSAVPASPTPGTDSAPAASPSMASSEPKAAVSVGGASSNQPDPTGSSGAPRYDAGNDWSARRKQYYLNAQHTEGADDQQSN